jgi:deoxyinosine 3'endonuclease (endonuclease V)
VDVSYFGTMDIDLVTVLDYESLELLETHVAICEVKMLYVPTLSSFREIPLAMQ